ncbi:DUF1801 domain-containing protein [Maribacter algicola]|uniref:DUF1801 domain-containing protein n=1 Tax=Meishania litoralis TaxID=3434685 RepID=A0ACC7LKD8_9FLAO
MNEAVDNYIKRASVGTQPIIIHLRALVQKALPEIVENIKWNAPNFEYGEKNVCSIMAFKKHVNFMFYQGKSLKDPKGVLENIGEKSMMKGIKGITKLSDLPDDKILVALIEEAVRISKN